MTHCPKQENNILTLENASVQKPYVISNINSELQEKYIRRLYELGFLQGEKITLLKKSIQRKIYLVSIRGIVFSIRKEIASQILLEAL